MTNNNEHLQWKKIGEHTFKGAFKTYITKKLEAPDGTVHEFDVSTIKNGMFSMALALTGAMDVIIARQYRAGPELVVDDMPAGIPEGDESPEDTMRRELMEETGYQSSQIIDLNPSGNVQGPYEQIMGHYFLALNCTQVYEQSLDHDEFIEVTTLPLRSYVNKVLRKGRASHADCGWLAIDYMLQNKMITLEDIAAE